MRNKLVDLLMKHKGKNLKIATAAIGVVAVGVFSFSVSGNLPTEQLTSQVISSDIDNNYAQQYNKTMESKMEYYQAEAYVAPVCYQLEVNDDLVLVFESVEELEKALEMVQNDSIGDRFTCEVQLEKSENGFVAHTTATPKNVLEGEMTNYGLSTSSAMSVEEVEPVALEGLNVIGHQEELTPVDSGSENNEPQLSFNENMSIREVHGENLVTVTAEEAASILCKTDVAPDEYVVVSGDSPYTIALDYDMTLDELYAINDGLEEKAKGLQIGDTIIVEVLEPELSVVVQEKIQFFDVIEKEVVYKDDPDMYKTLEKVESEGADGTKQVTAVVETMNGEELSRLVVSEEVVVAAQDKVILVGTKALPEKGAIGNFVIPLSGYTITSPFGPRWGGMHTGVDLAADYGVTIKASDGGTVTVAGWSGGYGYMVEIDHGNGRVTRYAHCSEVYVSVGQVVGQKEPIAALGNSGNSTGPHCHFEIRIDGDPVNPMNYVQ